MVAYKRASSINTDASSGNSLSIGDSNHTTTITGATSINGHLTMRSSDIIRSYNINTDDTSGNSLSIGRSNLYAIHTTTINGNLSAKSGNIKISTNDNLPDVDDHGIRSGIVAFEYSPNYASKPRNTGVLIYSSPLPRTNDASNVTSRICIGTLKGTTNGQNVSFDCQDLSNSFSKMQNGIFLEDLAGKSNQGKLYLKSSKDASISAPNGTISLDAKTVQLNAAISYGSIIDVSTSGKSINFANTPYFILKTHATLNAGSSGGAYDTKTTNIPNDTMLVLIQESDNTCGCQRSAYAYFTMNGTTETHSVEHRTSSGLGTQVKLLFFHKSGSRSIMKVI